MLKQIMRPIYRIYKNHCNKILRGRFKACCDDLRFHPDTSNFTYNTISLGKNVFINERAYFSGEITVGNNVLFGPDVFITSGDHDYTVVGQLIGEQKRIAGRRVIIDDDCWIGAKVFINKGVHIYEGAIIGGASVVTKNIPPYTLCLGTPCKPIKLRYSDDELRKHFKILNRSQEEAEEMIIMRCSMLKEKGLENL